MTERIGSSWGLPAPQQQSFIYFPDRFKAIDFIKAQKGPLLPYGYGNSYGDVCLNQSGTLISCQWLDRLISFDNKTGLLRCEAGVTIGDIQKFAIPQGWCLPVSPGSQWISIGGAIANDVHGKNHHRNGTFGCHVTNLCLLRSDGSFFNCSKKENIHLFCATIGGLGLTGFIIEATLKLQPCPSPHLFQERIPFNSLSEFFLLSDESERNWDYSVAWVDCVTQKAGRGIFTRANFHKSNIPYQEKQAYDLPYPFKGNLINRNTNCVMASLLFHTNRFSKNNIDDYVSFFYPLDRIKNWSKFYGQKGMYQFQCVIPYEKRELGLQQLIKELQQSRIAGFISVLKTFTDKPSPGLLSFPMHGVTLAVDFAASEQAKKLIAHLTNKVIRWGGRIYTAKDALMAADSFRISYPKLDEFLFHRDPGICSDFARRLIYGGNDG